MNWVYWNPPIKAFTIPWIDHDVVWYGILFACGITASYFVAAYLLSRMFVLAGSDPLIAKARAFSCMDKLCIYLTLCMIIGSRLFHLVFYEPISYWMRDPFSVIKIWQGGLASHGGVVGLFVGMALFLVKEQKNYPEITFKSLVDLLVVPSMITGTLIRVGNFINQEILGTVTKVPWGVVFGATHEGMRGIALHPVMLYEALVYLMAAALFFALFNRLVVYRGRLAGLFFLTVFSARFFLEFFKKAQSYYMQGAYALSMGQLLTLPLVVFGAVLFYQSLKSGKTLLLRDVGKKKRA